MKTTKRKWRMPITNMSAHSNQTHCTSGHTLTDHYAKMTQANRAQELDGWDTTTRMKSSMDPNPWAHTWKSMTWKLLPSTRHYQLPLSMHWNITLCTFTYSLTTKLPSRRHLTSCQDRPNTPTSTPAPSLSPSSNPQTSTTLRLHGHLDTKILSATNEQTP